MGWFQIGGTGSGGQGGTGGTGSGSTSTGLTAAKNFNQSSFNIVGPKGKVIQSVPVNLNFQSSYSYILNSEMVGQNGIKTQFTGDHKYAAGSLDNFNTLVADPNGNGLTESVLGTVNKIVAGAGIYISAPNGQNVVTISTEPLNLQTFKHDLYDISWSTSVPDKNGEYPYGIPGQFTAVGTNGSILRSRDGHNWTEMKPNTSTAIYSVTSEISNDILDNHMEYCGVGISGVGLYGRLGSAQGDSFTAIGQLYDQTGAITEDLNTTIIIPIDARLPPIPAVTQLKGGITEWAIFTGGSADQGAPVIELANGDVITNYKLTSAEFQRGNGTPTLVFSKSSNDSIQIKVVLYSSDVRFTPGTGITGQFPYQLSPLLVDSNGVPLLDNQGRARYYSDAYGPVVIFEKFANGQYWFTPWIKFTLYTVNSDGSQTEYASDADYYSNNSYWGYIDGHSAFARVPLGPAGSLAQGYYYVRIDTWGSDPGSSGVEPDYTFNGDFLVGP